MIRTILATGLACLDVMGAHSEDVPKLSAGGCPNALILLQHKGWNAVPIVELGEDRAGDYIVQEFLDWNVDTRFVSRRSDINTPVYVLSHQNGGHIYEKHCPYCQTRFPLYTPLSPESVNAITNSFKETIDFFYFDKVSLAALQLAEFCKQRSAVVMFEPNRIDDEALFYRCIQISDMVKYSHERRAGIHQITDSLPLSLEIETAGSEGLRYRVFESGLHSEWRSLPSVPVTDFMDAAGAGDWLTASVIDSIGCRSRFQTVLQNTDELKEILIAGQKVSAYNCRFRGARGALYTERPMVRGRDFCWHCHGKSLF